MWQGRLRSVYFSFRALTSVTSQLIVNSEKKKSGWLTTQPPQVCLETSVDARDSHKIIIH
jgi:hypothetical protein